MTTGQRVLVITGALLLAWVLNVSFCDWHVGYRVPTFQSTATFEQRAIVLHERGTPDRDEYTGLVVDAAIDKKSGIIWGVTTPLGLLGLCGYLLLGWRHQGRARRGLCPDCGYDLKGDAARPSARCPECGWSTPAGAAR